MSTSPLPSSASLAEPKPSPMEEVPSVSVPAPTGPPASLDLVFIVDCTGSMGSYIASAQANIRTIIESLQSSETSDIRFGLVEYRDHPPQESTYITRVHDFTTSIGTMRTYVDGMSASGGGDGPEAVTAGLHQALNMNWRKEATKISVLIADAPPHGLEPSGDGFPNGDPDGHDPLVILREMAANQIICYAVGCEPALGNYTFARDFMVTVAETTGGQAIALSSATLLAQVIMGTAAEELNLQKIMRKVEGEIAAQLTACGLDSASEEELLRRETEIASKVHEELKKEGVRTRQMKGAESSRLVSAHVATFSSAPSLASCKATLMKDLPSHPVGRPSGAPVMRSAPLRRSSGEPPMMACAAPPMPAPMMMMAPSCAPSFAPPPAPAAVFSAAVSYDAVEDDISVDQVSRMMKRSMMSKKSRS